jgi:tripartite-type tricarboxylate transporter receptor subunit TctC
MTEAGYPHIEGDSWVGILAPAGTPAEPADSVRVSSNGLQVIYGSATDGNRAS